MKSGSKGWLVGVEAGFIQWDYEGPCYSSEPAGRLCCRCWQVQIGTEFGGTDSRHGFVADDLHKSRPRIRLYFFKCCLFVHLHERVTNPKGGLENSGRFQGGR